MNDEQTIHVHDDLLPVDALKALASKYANGRFQYYWSGNAEQPNPTYHWHIDLVDKGGSNREDLSGYLETMKKLYEHEHAVWTTVREQFFNGRASLLRMYVNGYTFGTEGAAHTDSDDASDVTVVCYLNEQWKPEWAGETVVFTEDHSDIERAVLPKLGRVLVFPGNRLHAGRGVSRLCTQLRLVLVMKVATVDG